jgi:uncharacterized protein
MDDLLIYAGLCVSAMAAGAVNSIAGGGTLLTFPALQILGGISPVLANGTSTVAVMPGSVAGAGGYRRELYTCRRWIGLLIVPSVLGGAVGALLVLWPEETVFAALIPWLILLAAVLFALQPVVARLLRLKVHTTSASRATLAAIVCGQFAIAIYGGYFGAGIGILMLTSLAFLGLDSIHHANALKTFLAACINGTAAVVFVCDNKVHWPYALAMAAAAIVGGYFGARLALRMHPAAVRWVVILIGFGLAGYYFYRQWH